MPYLYADYSLGDPTISPSRAEASVSCCCCCMNEHAIVFVQHVLVLSHSIGVHLEGVLQIREKFRVQIVMRQWQSPPSHLGTSQRCLNRQG